MSRVPPRVRLQTHSSGDAPESTALRSNFLGNTASGNNIYARASQTVAHGSVTIYDKVTIVPQRNENNKNNVVCC
jgi:hypothetical protein